MRGAFRGNGPTVARELIKTVVLTVIVFLAINISVRPYSVDGPSMQPGLHTDDRVLVNLLAYDFGSPRRGDVIVFHPPSDPSLSYVKRVIGIPGDTILVTANAIVVNGHPLNEPYIQLMNKHQPENNSVLPAIKLGPNQYFVLGDNRQNSIDSRIFGYVPRANIIGKAELVYWPLPVAHGISTYSSDFSGVGR
ncbi:MAG TPA: signal peptidase I [Ktedonobacterales bacterium]|nr:signal peptidase I [Ktedonobacterales bacterium]